VSNPWRPSTDPGDVIVHHAAPKVWIAARVVQPGDLVGTMQPIPQMKRDAALTEARTLLAPGRQIYIHHHDDAEWEPAS
jgi:hypothetical protein